MYCVYSVFILCLGSAGNPGDWWTALESEPSLILCVYSVFILCLGSAGNPGDWWMALESEPFLILCVMYCVLCIVFIVCLYCV